MMVVQKHLSFLRIFEKVGEVFFLEMCQGFSLLAFAIIFSLPFF
jgi:hypothetical protein